MNGGQMKDKSWIGWDGLGIRWDKMGWEHRSLLCTVQPTREWASFSALIRHATLNGPLRCRARERWNALFLLAVGSHAAS